MLLTTYLLTTLKRLTDRITPFHAICLRFNGLYRGRVPLFTTQASSAALSNNFLYIPRLYLKNNLYISGIFFLKKKSAYCLLYLFTNVSCRYYIYVNTLFHA